MVIDPWVWAFLLLVLGMGLAILEIFIPSGGILGFLSICSILSAIVMGFRQGSAIGVLILLVAIVGLPVVIVLALKVWPKTAMGRRVLLMAPKSDDVLPEDPRADHLKSLIGQVAKIKCKMLPSGAIVVDGRTVEAVSEGMPIEAGELVRVIKIRGNRLVVRRVEDAAPSELAEDPLMRPVRDPFDEEPPV